MDGEPKKVIGNFRKRVKDEEVAVLTLAQITNPFNFYRLMFMPIVTLIAWLQDVGLLADRMNCHRCGGPCEKNNRSKSEERPTSFRCHKCNVEIAFTKFSFFYKAKFTIQDILVFIRDFALGSTLKGLSLTSGKFFVEL